MSGWLLMGGPASDSSMGVLVVGLVTVLVDRRIDESFPVDFLSFRRHQNGPRVVLSSKQVRVSGSEENKACAAHRVCLESTVTFLSGNEDYY